MTRPAHALAETAATYAASPAARHVKLSITLPEALVAEIRDAAAASGIGVSGVIAAAVRQALAAAEQARLDRALELDAEDNRAWAEEALATTARAWSSLEW
jgi:hypothetical protein